jgi:hypothetical protein
MEYKVENKPKFCSKCGTSLGGVLTQEATSPQQAEQTGQEEVGLEEQFDFQNLSSLDIDITRFEKPKVTVGDIMGTAAAGGSEAVDDSEERPSMRDPNYTPEAFMEEFSKEAGTGRKQPRNETKNKES